MCHLPIEIGKVINTLPQTFDQYETISVKLKLGYVTKIQYLMKMLGHTKL